MEKRRREQDKNGELSTHSAAKAPCLSPSTPPDPRVSHELVQTKGQKGSVGLLDLPDEIILQILGHLPVSDLVMGVRKTCMRLHDLSHWSCLWENQTFKYKANRNGPRKDDYLSYYISLVRQSCLVSRFSHGEGEDPVPGAGECTQQLVVGIVQNRVTSLTEDCVDRTKVYSHSIVNQHILYPRLQRLVLKVSSMPNTIFLYQHLGLHSLTIDCASAQDCGQSGTDFFNRLIWCTSLQNLQLKFEKWQEPLGWGVRAIWRAMKYYFQTGPALTRLRLDVPVNDDVFATILDHCEKLQDLQLSNGHLTLRALKQTLECPNDCLTALRLKGCELSDPSMVYAIAQSFRHLKQLELSTSVTSEWNQALEALPSSKFGLTVLKVGVTQGRSAIQQSIQKENDENGTDEPLPKVMCPALPTEPEEARLEELEFIGSRDLSLNLNHCLQPHLRSLVATKPLRRPSDGNEAIAISSLESLVLTCPKLQHVDLRGYRMPPNGLEFLQALPRLTSFRCFVSQFRGHRERPEPPADTEDARKTMRHLELNFKYSAGKELGSLCAFFPGVTSLTILHRFVVRNYDIKVIASGLPCLDKFVMELDYYDSEDNYSKTDDLTYHGMQHLLTLCRRLRSVTWMVPLLAHRGSLARALVRHPTLCDLAIYDRSKKDFEKYDDKWFVKEIVRNLEEELSLLSVKEPSGLITYKYVPTEVKLRNGENYTLFDILHFSLGRWREEARSFME